MLQAGLILGKVSPEHTLEKRMETYILLAIATLLFFILNSLRQIGRRQAAFDESLLSLSRSLGFTAQAGSEPSEKVRQLAAEKKTYIDAIRTYRQETGTEFIQAKSIIDSVAFGKQ